MFTQDLEDTLQEGIRSASLCSALCFQLLNELLTWDGDPVSPEHIQLLRECARCCRDSRNQLIQDSTIQHGGILCAELCERCAEQCDRYPRFELMRLTATACRRAATAFRALSSVNRNLDRAV